MPRPKVVNTPEFKRALDTAVEAALAKQSDIFEQKIASLLAGNAAAAPADGSSTADVLGTVLEKLSINLQAINSQGARGKPLSPAEITKREAAQGLLVDLLAESRARPQVEWPKYKLIAKTYISERMIEPFYKRDSKGPAIATEIAYTGVPNDAMVPIDDSAKAIFNAWRKTTGGRTVLVPTADNRPLHVTAAGLVVRGEPPKRSTVSDAQPELSDVVVSNDYTQPEVAVLGTVARKARTNAYNGQQ